MTALKMREKVERIFEENSNKIIATYNDDTLALFAINPYMMYRMNNTKIMTVHINQDNTRREALLRVDVTAGKPVKDDTSSSGLYNPLGDVITVGKCKGSNKTIYRAYNGQNYVYFDKKFTRGFPKNTVYFTAGKKDGVSAAIVEGSTVHIFAVIMPLYIQNDSDFTPDTVITK